MLDERSPPAGAPRAAAAAAFEDLPGPVWEFHGPDHVLAVANRAACALLHDPRAALDRPVVDGAPALATAAVLAQLTAVRTTGAVVRGAVWTIDTGVPRGHVLLEADLVAVHRDGTDGVLVHAREATGSPAAGEHEAAAALHRGGAPPVLPVLPGVEAAGRYAPAEQAARAGGDWFDVVVTDEGLVAAVAGDVAGHGAAAAAAMAELRAVLRAALRDGEGLGPALARVHRHAARAPGTRAATVVAALLDPDTGAVAAASCGHPLPLVRAADATVRPLPVRPGAPLGTGGPPPVVHESVLGPDEMLLLHTDGLLLRAGRSPADGVALLATAASAPADGPAALCRAVTAALLEAGHPDDAVLLAVRRRRVTVPAFAVDLEADPAELAGLRERLTDWLAALDVTADGNTALPLVVSELVSNSIEHAYPGGAGQVRVRVQLDGRGAARVRVADDGRWRPARSGGFGLVVARELSTGLTVHRGPDGTRVEALCPLHHPTVTVADRPRLSAVPGDGLTVEERDGEPLRIRVSGPVDAGSADEFRSAVLRGTAGGTRAAILDLTGVSLLASAGVRVLHEAAGAPVPPVVVAPPGCPSRMVLELTRLGHLLTGPG